MCASSFLILCTNFQEIRRSFKKIALEKHPDKNPDDPNAHDEFVRINTAFEVGVVVFVMMMTMMMMLLVVMMMMMLVVVMMMMMMMMMMMLIFMTLVI